MICSNRYASASHPFHRRRGLLAAPLLLFILATLCCSELSAAAKQPKPKVLIKFATLAPDGSSWMKSMRQLDTDVREATENRLGFKFYPGGVQGDEKDVLRKMRNGQIHGGGFTGYGLGGIASDVRVLELPFMFENHDELDFVRGELDSLLTQTFAEKQMVLLGWADVGFINLFSNAPITSPGDLQNFKLWIWSGDRLAELFFKAFRVSPIPLAVPDVLTSLQMGVIDAVYSSPLACVAVQWFTRVAYMTDMPITHSIGAILVSEQALRGVSRTDVDTLLRLSRRHMRDLNEKTRVQNREAVDVMKNEGIEVVHVDDATRKLFFEIGREAWAEGVDTIYSKDILDRVTALLRAYRSGERRNAGANE
jgi:TRAP-type C4-dicarboxylate transport system substrate-binding protein